jgi:hypothetical protein
MNVEIGAEAALFPEKEYMSGIFVAVGRKIPLYQPIRLGSRPVAGRWVWWGLCAGNAKIGTGIGIGHLHWILTGPFIYSVEEDTLISIHPSGQSPCGGPVGVVGGSVLHHLQANSRLSSQGVWNQLNILQNW